MKIEEQILQGHIEAAAADQVARDLARDGYDVARQTRFGELQADLVARKGDEVLVYEFKTPSAGKSGWAQDMARLRAYAAARGARFRLVFVRPPRESRVDIDNIESLLEDAIGKAKPEALRRLGAGFVVDQVSDVEFDAVDVRHGEIAVRGAATVTVRQYGVDPDHGDDPEIVDMLSLPMGFDIVLGPDGGLKRINGISIDPAEA